MNSKFFKARHKARRYALQALYGWLMSGNDLRSIEDYSLQDKNHDKVDVEYFRGLLYNIPANIEKLDAIITPYLSRTINEIDPIELTILRMATYELQYNIEVPYKVIINEALELTKSFGATDSHKFVNGILDKLAKALRGAEF